MGIITSFEVLAQPLVPGVPDIPYVQQGTFVQITNLGPNDQTISLNFNATPAFVAQSGNVSLFTNFIDNNGNVTQYPTNIFLTAPIGFAGVTIPANETIILGVQYVLSPGQSQDLVGATPQDGLGTRGTVTLIGQTGASFLVLATIRQVFTNFTPTGAVSNLSEAAYSVPLVNGPQQNF